MPAAIAVASSGATLSPGSAQRVDARLRAGVSRARATGDQVLTTITLSAGAELDPLAVACASRRPGERWFSLDQPVQDRSLATLGAVRALSATGTGRFDRVAAAWRELVAEGVIDPPLGPRGPRGSGAIAVGGFSFDPDGSRSPQWDGFGPAELSVPEVALLREGDAVRITFATMVAPDDTVEDLRARIDGRVRELRSAPLPLLDPAPAARSQVHGAAPPSHYVAAVQRGVERIRSGMMEKIVLAREVQVLAPEPHDAPAVLGVLREAFPECYVVAAGVGEATFLAASPELLVRRDGLRATTVALAGSTRRSADPAVDDHLGEQLLQSAKDRSEHEIVARQIEQALGRVAVWVTRAPEPSLARMANIQHLATPIRAQLAAPVSAIELAGLLHPTPAVGGAPRDVAVPEIPALEGLDRGWYAGVLGWTDAAEDGELCVGLRCALLRGRTAHCYAGVGVVRDSDPQAELAETELKLGALLPVLAG